MNPMLLNRPRWHGGQLLAFSGLDGATDYEHGLTARTAFGEPGLEIKLPGECRLEFPVGPLQRALVAGDFFEAQGDGETVRGAFLDAYHLLIEGPCRVAKAADAVRHVANADRLLVGSASHFEPAKLDANLGDALRERRRWMEVQRMPARLPPRTARTLAKALSVMKTQVYTPEGAIRHRWTTPDRWPHRAMWLWDSAFHAIGWRHLDPALARDMLSAVLDAQTGDGFMAHMIKPDGTSEITQPPVLALGVKLVHQAEPALDWVRELYSKLCAYVEWDFRHRDTDGAGLVEWFIQGDTRCRSGESGMDNSPRFDSATQLDATDFNAFLALECETLGQLAEDIGRPADAARWRERHQTLCRKINERLWSPEHRFYVDYDVTREAPSPVLASAGFLPLICGAPSAEQAASLVRHLGDPEMFGSAFPVASIAVRDRTHYEKDMWRGPVWININWLIAYGLERCGQKDSADDLRTRTRHEVEEYCERFGTLFEFYDDRAEAAPPDLLRKGKPAAGDPNPYHHVFHDYGWTATLFADLIFSGG